MPEQIVIDIAADFMSATIPVIHPEFSELEIRRTVDRNRVCKHVDWPTIIAALAQAKRTGTPVFNTIIATAQKPSPKFRLGSGAWFDLSELDKMRQDLSSHFSIVKDHLSVETSGGIFVSVGDTFMSMEFGISVNDVRGENFKYPKPGPVLFPAENVIEKSTAEGYEYIAKLTGYVVITPHGKLDIASPFRISEDRLEMYVILLPLRHGHEILADKIARSSGSEAGAAASLAIRIDKCDIEFSTKGTTSQSQLFRKGVPPLQGRDGRVVMYCKDDHEKLAESDSKIDFKESFRFREVAKGTLLAIEYPAVIPKPGIDVSGEIIRVGDVRRVAFSCGPNIERLIEGDRIKFIAAATGIISVEENYAGISTELVVNGNVDAHTGNIKFSGDVLVKGCIRSGYSIDCGGNLKVLEMIEDRVLIDCKNSLFVKKGIFGENTGVKVGGDAEIGFLQNTKVRVAGNLLIKEYCYQSEVFAGGEITVTGDGLTSRERGAVVGGYVSSFGSMKLHSAGSSSAQTMILCGVDPSFYDKLVELRRVSPAVKKQISDLQMKIGLNFSDAKLPEKFRAMSDARREIMKKELLKLKELIEMNSKIEKDLSRVAALAIAPDIHTLSVDITGQIIPEVHVVISECRKRISHSQFSQRFAIEDGDISMKSL